MLVVRIVFSGQPFFATLSCQRPQFTSFFLKRRRSMPSPRKSVWRINAIIPRLSRARPLGGFSRRGVFLAALPLAAAWLLMGPSVATAQTGPGYLYVSDAGAGNIYSYSPGGTQYTFAANLNDPLGIAFDSAANLYEGDSGTGNLNVFPAGSYAPGGAAGTTIASGIFYTYGVTTDTAGNVYVATQGTTIQQFSGWTSASPGTQGATIQMNTVHSNPFGITFDSHGNLWATDYGSNTPDGSGNIVEFMPDGMGGFNQSQIFATGLDVPYDLAFDSLGNLFVSSFADGAIDEFAPNGHKTVFATGLNQPLGLAFNSAGDLFEADYGSGDINEFTPTGTMTVFATGMQNPAYLAFQASVPEPATIVLALVGSVGVGLVARRRNRR